MGRAGEIAGLRLTIAKRVGESETLYGSVTATEGAEMLEGSTEEIVDKLFELLKAKGGIK